MLFERFLNDTCIYIYKKWVKVFFCKRRHLYLFLISYKKKNVMEKNYIHMYLIFVFLEGSLSLAFLIIYWTKWKIICIKPRIKESIYHQRFFPPHHLYFYASWTSWILGPQQWWSLLYTNKGSLIPLCGEFVF